jgi:hypothetical protein
MLAPIPVQDMVIKVSPPPSIPVKSSQCKIINVSSLGPIIRIGSIKNNYLFISI